MRTIRPDLSALIPVLPKHGSRAPALAAAIRDLIVDGHLTENEKLPPGRILAKQLGVSRGIVIAAYEQLIAEGFAVGRVGAGTFVSQALPGVKPRKKEILSKLVIQKPRPGQLGLGMADEKSLTQLRKLLNRSLAQKTTRHPGYPDPRGSENLRIEIANYLRVARAARVEPGQIVLTTGAQQSIDLIFRAALKTDDQIWIEDPCYPMAAQAIRGNGLSLVPVRVTEEGLDVNFGIMRAPNAKAVYVTPSHQFPLGVTLALSQRIKLLEWADRSGAWIIEDDYDSEFRFSGAPLTSLQGMDKAERVIYVGSFSKVLLPGLRCGYMIVPPSLLPRVLEVRQYMDRSPVNIIDDALAAFLREGHFARHLKRARTKAVSARNVLVKGLLTKGIQVEEPNQGLHLVGHVQTLVQETALLSRLDNAGIAARALSGMYQSKSRGDFGIVVGFSGFSPSAFAVALKRL